MCRSREKGSELFPAIPGVTLLLWAFQTLLLPAFRPIRPLHHSQYRTQLRGGAVVPSDSYSSLSTINRDSYYRGAGDPLTCNSNVDQDAGLCYDRCF